jgi:predicted glycosyltransferase
MYIKVENDSLVRDTNSGAILETDVSKLNQHRAIRARLNEREQKIDLLMDRINNLEAIIERMTNGNNSI